MNLAKTVCAKPSSTIAIIPAGLPVKLEYNEHGLLKRFSVGFNATLDPTYNLQDALTGEFEEGSFKYNEVLQAIKKIVPQSINTTGGTTWVYGICYSDKIPCNEGTLGTALVNSYMNDIIKGTGYSFYAGYVTSKAISIKGYMIMKSFLGAAGFKMLPSTLVPVAVTEETISSIVDAPSYPFRKEFIAGFFVHESLNSRYVISELMQIKVTNAPTPYVEEDGFLKGEVVTGSGWKHVFDYSTLVHHDVTKDCTLLVEKSPNNRLAILCTRVNEISQKILNNKGQDIKCPICNKLYRVGTSDAPIQCDDPHCLSRSYADALKMLAVFNLPELDYQMYRKYVDSKEVQCLTDILEVPPFSDMKIEAPLAEAMYAVIPTAIVPNFSILERFANKCNNKIDTVVYYLENPLRIETDLDITDPIVRRLADWLQDPYNVSTLITIFDRVTISAKKQKFDGAPIFRGNTIAVTGRFKRGDYPEIEAILMSYAAKVIPSIELGQKLPDVLLIGSLNAGISGQMVQKAKAHNIPITYEDDFFTRYEIDQDLASNLL